MRFRSKFAAAALSLALGAFAPGAHAVDSTASVRASENLFAANVAFGDHSVEEMQAGLYQAVTVESVIRFVEQSQALAARRVVRLP